MVLAHLQNYTLMDILTSNQFYESIIAARNITRNSNCESSFCVWGDTRRYTLTIPLEGRKRFCDAWEEKTGGPHHPCGFGLYTPKGKSRLLDVHYHPLDNSAIPSIIDLESQLEVLIQNFELHHSSKYPHNLISVVAHHSRANNITRLFFGQYDVSRGIPEEGSPHSLSCLLDKEIKKRGYIPHKVAQMLTATGKYRAEVVSFRKRSEYFDGMKRLEGWTL